MKALFNTLLAIGLCMGPITLQASPATENPVRMSENQRFAFYDQIDEAIDRSNANLMIRQSQLYGEVLNQAAYLEYQMAQQSHEIKLALAGKFRLSELMNDEENREAFLELINKELIEFEDLSDFQKILDRDRKA